MNTGRDLSGVLSPYSARVFLWEGSGPLTTGTPVGEVGMASSYAVLLDAPAGAPQRFTWVQEGIITNVMAHQPQLERSVFDARGSFLGCGGEPLEQGAPPPAGTLMELIPTRRTVVERAVVEATQMTEYVFPLRRGLLIRVSLPEDLTAEEAERLGNFLGLLPT